MSDEKRYTERELVLAKREAFMRGADHTRNCAEQCASHNYPLPKTVRPRVVRDAYGREWKLVQQGADRLEAQFREQGENTWQRTPGTGFLLDDRIIRALADLFANPTEEVEEEC